MWSFSRHPVEDYLYLEDAYIYNNIFAFNGNDIRLGDSLTHGSHGGNIHYWNNTNFNNTDTTSREFNTGNFTLLDFRNNVVYTTPGSGDYFGNDYPGWQVYSVGSNNIFYGLSNPLQSWDDTATSFAVTNPLMTDPINFDFSLSAESPGVGSGTDIVSSYVTTDYFGKPRSIYDIGAIAVDRTVNLLNMSFTGGVMSGGVTK